MATNIKIPPFRLSPSQKKLLKDFLNGKTSMQSTAAALGVTRQQLYTMCTALTRHASTTGKINIEEVLKSY